ncbi:BnaC05g07830D [Brassica napus]|nr:BnaC05g07830D [Brassica napus]
MDRSPPLLELHTTTKKLPPSEGMENKVTVVFETVIDYIHNDPVTGSQTLIGSSPDHSLFFAINFSTASTCPSHISDLIIRCLLNYYPSTIESLTTRIASAGLRLGFGFEINLLLTTTHQRILSVGSSPSLLRKLVFKGRIDVEELEILKMGKEPCSICLEDLSCGGGPGGVPTRMPCSHVFHIRCLLKWFSRKSTCPMCRGLVLSHMTKKQHREGQYEVFN